MTCEIGYQTNDRSQYMNDNNHPYKMIERGINDITNSLLLEKKNEEIDLQNTHQQKVKAMIWSIWWENIIDKSQEN
jgi:hypothetical protein